MKNWMLQRFLDDSGLHPDPDRLYPHLSDGLVRSRWNVFRKNNTLEIQANIQVFGEESEL